jgi:hypothetical protein
LLTVESNRRAESFHAHMCVDDAGPAMKRLRAFRSATSGSSSSMHGGRILPPPAGTTFWNEESSYSR